MQYRVKYHDGAMASEDMWLEFPDDTHADKDSKDAAWIFDSLPEATGVIARLERENEGCDYCVVPVLKKRGD